MYLKTRNKRYRRKRFISLRRILFWIIVPLIIIGGVFVYQNADQFRPMIQQAINTVVSDTSAAIATSQAPPPTPTQDPSSNVQLALSAWNSGSIQESVRLYSEVIEALPNDLNAHYFLTYGLILQGNYEAALEAAENTVTANPFSPDSWAIRALALNRSGEYGQSIASALRALELDPSSARARAFLAESYADIGNTSRALSEINRALEENPDSVEARYIKGMLDWEVNFDFEAAKDQLVDVFEESGLTYIGVDLALMYFSSWIDEPESGVAILERILERNPENTSVLYQLGRYQWRNRGDSDQAITLLTRCVNADSEYIPCHYELGRALLVNERNSEARLEFEKVIELGSQNPYHYYWAGELQKTDLGDCSAAMAFFDRGYEIALNEQATGSTRYASSELLSSLIDDLEAAMSPCRSFNPVAVPTSQLDEIPPETTPEASGSP